MYDKPITNGIVSWGKMKAFPLKSEMKQGCSLSPLLFIIVLEFLEQWAKERKRIWIGKEDVKLSLFAQNMIQYLKDSKYPYVWYTLSKVPVYKIDIQKLVAFLYTNSELPEKESRK
jgi:hypothetical protein